MRWISLTCSTCCWWCWRKTNWSVVNCCKLRPRPGLNQPRHLWSEAPRPLYIRCPRHCAMSTTNRSRPSMGMLRSSGPGMWWTPSFRSRFPWTRRSCPALSGTDPCSWSRRSDGWQTRWSCSTESKDHYSFQSRQLRRCNLQLQPSDESELISNKTRIMRCITSTLQWRIWARGATGTGKGPLSVGEKNRCSPLWKWAPVYCLV